MRGSDNINNKKVQLFVLGIFFFIVMSISGIYALTNQTTEDSFSTGIVDIKLQIYTLNNENNEIKNDDENKNVMPGDVVSVIPKVQNLGEDCYLRFKASYVDETTNFYDYITGMSDDWNKYGEYYYYNDILKSKETVKIFDTIKIPTYLSQNDGTITLRIVAEAIQTKNFEPDYTSNNPWKGITPEKSVKSSYNINNNKSKITIKYENNTKSDITVSNEFFENINVAMPGDSFSEKIVINNKTKKNAKYFLRLEATEDDKIEKELLSKINLKITNNTGNILYNGKLLTDEQILLGQIGINESDNLNFEIFIPNYLGNEYTVLNPEFSWIFSAEYEENSSTIPKTGDTIDLAIIIFFISTTGLIIIMLLVYRERKKEEYL